MGRLIDADNLIDSLRAYPAVTDFMRRMLTVAINDQETVEIQEHKIGRWIPAGTEGWECSECWRTTTKPGNYCAVCGSRNRKEDEE